MFLSKESDTKILQNIYFAYKVGIISFPKCIKYKQDKIKPTNSKVTNEENLNVKLQPQLPTLHWKGKGHSRNNYAKQTTKRTVT